MRNERLRHAKIARNKRRSIQRKKDHPERPNRTHVENRLWILSFFTTGSRHGARKFRASFRRKASERVAKLRIKNDPFYKMTNKMGIKL